MTRTISKGIARFVKSRAVTATTTADKVETKTKQIGGAKNGKARTVPLKKSPRTYTASPLPVPKQSRKSTKSSKGVPVKLRQSITPGTVVVLLAGRHRGKRCIVLKQMEESGMLLVSGPFKYNGVPLRRVNQSYVLATSTKVPIDGKKVDVCAIVDGMFASPKSNKSSSKPSAASLFGGKDKDGKHTVSAERVALQKKVDDALVKCVEGVADLAGYLSVPFSLTNGQYPHLLKF